MIQPIPPEQRFGRRRKKKAMAMMEILATRKRRQHIAMIQPISPRPQSVKLSILIIRAPANQFTIARQITHKFTTQNSMNLEKVLAKDGNPRRHRLR